MGARENIVRALLKGKPGGPHPGGIHVYHSSPHDFDKFDWSKLRTGEGANMYGSGFYFAENPAVSGQGGQYWKQFQGSRFPTAERRAAETLQEAGFDREKAIAALQQKIADPRYHWTPDGLERTQEQLRLLESGAPVGPRTYEVNINARPELMLGYDVPLANQPDILGAVRERAMPNASRVLHDFLKEPHPHATGKHLISNLEMNFGMEGPPQVLREAGIPGTRYLDQGSRMASPAGERTYNYVINDPAKLDILAKYGVVGTAGGGLGVLAAQDQYGEARQ